MHLIVGAPQAKRMYIPKRENPINCTSLEKMALVPAASAVSAPFSKQSRPRGLTRAPRLSLAALTIPIHQTAFERSFPGFAQ
ncbi:hypothetical protein BdWA1_000489 [Babesia duncani]|uniref:Uncharacterized protein n=1 Tax=Babesia duncani TaxID=323732 RepID=A0AAD9PM95_9APIC|nr:hypothetical protein BdWA1_000489 [Babesia duncani]